MTDSSNNKFHKAPMFPNGPPGMERFPNRPGMPPPRPGMPPRPPNIPIRPGMIPPPMRPTMGSPHNAPPDLGPPNGRIAGMRPPNLQPPPLRPGGPFPNYPPGFQNNMQQPSYRPHYSQLPTRSAPPAANTTLPKPPIFDKDGQPWLEACSAAGKVYYFNARTRETRWDRPESFEEAEAKKLQSAEKEPEEPKAEVNDTNNISDDEMKLSDNEAKDSDEMKISDTEMKDTEGSAEMTVEDDKMEEQDAERNQTDIAQTGTSDNDMNVSDSEMKEDGEEYYSPYLSETDSPPRSPLNVDQLPPVIITQKEPSEGDDGPQEKANDMQSDNETPIEESPSIQQIQQQKQQWEQNEEQQQDTPQKHFPSEQAQQHMQSAQPTDKPPNSLLALSQQQEEESSGDETLSSKEKQKTELKEHVENEMVLQLNEQSDLQEAAASGGKRSASPQSEISSDEASKQKDKKNQPTAPQPPVKPAQPLQPQPPFNAQGMPPGLPIPFGMPPALMRPPPGMPPPGFPGFPPRMPPGLVGQSRFPPFPGFRLPPPDFVPKTIGDWTEHRLPDGRLYYYNNRTKESKWDKPAEFLAPVKDESSEKKEDKGSEKESGEKEKKEKKSEAAKEVKEEKKQDEPNPAKPVASRPIVGTGWHLVWTGDGKVFFFNPTSKTSIWERPKELDDNETVDEILKQGPKGKSSPPEPDKTESSTEKVTVEVKSVTEEKLVKVEDLEPEIKKKKIEPEPGSIGALPVVSGNDNFRNGMKKIPEEVREVEVRKAIIPLEERMTMFTNLLKEKEVSAFSTWEKELHKILFDPRYLLLTMKERKQCFEKYVKIRAVEERKERIQKLKERKEEFKKLLEEVISSARISFSDFAGKNSKDTRYKAIEKMKDREALFNEFMTDFRKHEKERLKAREERLRKAFFELLAELNNLNEASQWKKVKSSIESDRRYELIGSSAKREQFFYEYIQELEDQRNVEPVSPASPAPPPPADDEEEPERPPSPEEDPDSMEKKERINASIRKREEEVRAQKEMYEKDREKERGIHLYEKAVQHFRALLADMVKDTQFTWKETRRSLRKDPRWSALDVLGKNEKEDLFEEHIKEIKEKRKKAFRKLLDESDVPLDAEWRDIRRKIKDDQRYLKFGTSESREEEFELYLKEKVTAARTDFRELLRECKLITYKSKKVAEENPNHIKDITAILKKDKRYLMMSSLSSERDRLVVSYIDELHKRGPPPPPTATNPSARYKKE